MNTENLATSGARLRRARFLAGLTTRREFEQKYNISANTLQGWEQGKNPLSEKGAKRVVEAFKGEGLMCTIDWLMHGTGMPPRPFEALNTGIEQTNNPTLSDLNLQEEESIYKETQLFKQNNPNAIVISVTDDAMVPHFHLGDYVGGVRLSHEELRPYLGNACIVELENNLIVPRYLHEGKEPGTYTLSSTNFKSTATPLTIIDTKITCAAPILWQRRKMSAL